MTRRGLACKRQTIAKSEAKDVDDRPGVHVSARSRFMQSPFAQPSAHLCRNLLLQAPGTTLTGPDRVLCAAST